MSKFLKEQRKYLKTTWKDLKTYLVKEMMKMT